VDGLETGDVDLRLWGKSRGLGDDERYPLVCHLLDAGAAARYLWEHYVPAGLMQFIADGFGVSVDHAGRLIALWAAMHDIGKLIPEFQVADPKADLSDYPVGRGLRLGHDVAGQQWLQATLPKLGYAAGATELPAFLVPQLLGGHHGRFYLGLESGRATLAAAGFRDDAWERQRRATLDAVCRIVGDPGPPPGSSPQAAVLACVIVILADWLVSRDTHLRSRMAKLPARGTDSELGTHFEESLAISADLAETAGLAQVRLRPGSFSKSFPHIENPNELQQSVATRLPDLVHGPGLLLVMAPPGLGKTETALYAAKVMGEVTGRTGVYLALPTMATADQMYLRVRNYLVGQAETAAALMLLHGMAWLNTHYQPDTEPAQVVTEDDHEGDPFLPAEWLLGRYRGMCGAWAVGTIDQALMAVLMSRFNALRLFGLAGKTVIVDEVHACDPYMQGLLLQLLRWLGSLGTPVVLLSATLTNRAARELVSAYLEGAGVRPSRHPPGRIMATPYPGWLYADAMTGAIESVSVPLPPALPLQVSVREISGSPGAGGGRPVPDRGLALRAELAPLSERGGCALVICTTVDEAQQTYLQLHGWFSDLSAAGITPPELELLHARFPAWQRKQITDRVTAKYGKNKDARPPAAVLVTTAIVEQSLDLDFDLIVSDLAPVALLLQRAGRCWRHQTHGIWRPKWASGPHLTVLVPPGSPKSPQLFRSWAAVYDESLLANTYRLLAGRAEISIPADVQDLVDAVYDDERFADGDLSKAALQRIGSEIALGQLANNITIPGPRAVNSLYELTEADVDPDLLVTRFDADSVRTLPAFADTDGRLWLDRACKIPVPGHDKTPDQDGCRTIIGHTVPVRGGLWLKGYDARSALPETWRRNIHLRDLVLLTHHRSPDGSFSPAVIGEREFCLDDVLGLRQIPVPAPPPATSPLSMRITGSFTRLSPG
jgi:CRISPR-associated endonuclease/helicase Cas3